MWHNQSVNCTRNMVSNGFQTDRPCVQEKEWKLLPTECRNWYSTVIYALLVTFHPRIRTFSFLWKKSIFLFDKCILGHRTKYRCFIQCFRIKNDFYYHYIICIIIVWRYCWTEVTYLCWRLAEENTSLMFFCRYKFETSIFSLWSYNVLK